MAAFSRRYVEARKPGPLAADKVVVIIARGRRRPDRRTARAGRRHRQRTVVLGDDLFDGSHGALKRGEYAFKAGASLRDVEEQLLSGKVVLHSLTLPEGLTSEQIVQRLRDNDVLVGDIKETPREGSLLPETYKFARGETRQALLTVMAKAQTKAVDEIWKKRAPDLPIKSPGELVTLASIVEKETGKVEERPRVAGVFVNRLQKHMKLQSDPTIVYGLVFGKGTLGHPITKAELDQATPYNTYNIEGLPPGPICNPGKAALEAVANPAHERALFRRRRHRRPRLRRDARPAPEERRALAPDREGRQGQAGARRRAAGAPATRGEIEPIDPDGFGALAPVAVPGPRGRRDARRQAGEARRFRAKREALLGAGGALSAAEDRGQVDRRTRRCRHRRQRRARRRGIPRTAPAGPTVAGGERSAFARRPGRPEGARGSLRQCAVADFAARRARRVSAARPTRAPAFDASEGTPLDPLLNKTYDLSYGNTVPDLK